MNIYTVPWISVFKPPPPPPPKPKKKEKKIKEEAFDIKMLCGSELHNNIWASFIHLKVEIFEFTKDNIDKKIDFILGEHHVLMSPPCFNNYTYSNDLNSIGHLWKPWICFRQCINELRSCITCQRYVPIFFI